MVERQWLVGGTPNEKVFDAMMFPGALLDLFVTNLWQLESHYGKINSKGDIAMKDKFLARKTDTQ